MQLNCSAVGRKAADALRDARKLKSTLAMNDGMIESDMSSVFDMMLDSYSPERNLGCWHFCISRCPAVPLVDEFKALEHLVRKLGALKLASRVCELSWRKLKTIILSSCEIETSVGFAVANALKTKTTLSLLGLNVNNFGDDGIEEIKTIFFSGNVNEPSVLVSFEEDQGLKDDDKERNEHGEGNTEILADRNTFQGFLKKPSSKPIESFRLKTTVITFNHLSGQPQYVELVANLFLDISTGCVLNKKTLTLMDAIMRDSVAPYYVSNMRFCDIVLD